MAEEKIEDDYGIEAFNIAKKEFEKDSTVYSLNEVKEEIFIRQNKDTLTSIN